VVERTIAWIDQNRRMSKDYERLCASGEAINVPRLLYSAECVEGEFSEVASALQL
jgi:hypothetical protein